MMLRVVPGRGDCVILRRPNEERTDRAIVAGRLDRRAPRIDALLRCNAILEAEEVGRLVLTDPRDRATDAGAWSAAKAPHTSPSRRFAVPARSEC